MFFAIEKVQRSHMSNIGMQYAYAFMQYTFMQTIAIWCKKQKPMPMHNNRFIHIGN